MISQNLGRILIGALLLVASQSVASGQASQSDPGQQGFHDALKNLEKRQDIVLEAMKNHYQNGLWFIGIMVGLVAMLSLIRHVQDQRLIRFQEQQLADAKELGNSYRANIDTTNALMVSLKNALEYYEKAQEALKTVSELATQQQKESSHWEEQMRSLNDHAIAINRQCRRNSHNDPEIQRLVRDFTAHYELLARSFETQEKLNANGHFILALHFRIENKYDDAIREFNTAISIAEEHKARGSEAYRTLPSNTSVQSWLTKLQNICAFHIAILQNNLGQYDDALKSFERALAYDPLDYQSLSYVPEVMFLGGLAAFSKIVDSFNAAITKIGKLGQEEAKGFWLSKEHLLAILHLKLANCYMAESPHGDYRVRKDAVKAEHHVRQALALDATFVFAKLSLAQLLHQQDREESYRLELFSAVFTVVKDIVSRTTETKILMMYYYIMVICCALGDIPHELPSIYAMRVYELVPKLPDASRIRIFSPLSKTDLRMDDFIRELKQFEEGSRTERRPSEKLSTHEEQGARDHSRRIRTVPRYRP